MAWLMINAISVLSGRLHRFGKLKAFENSCTVHFKNILPAFKTEAQNFMISPFTYYASQITFVPQMKKFAALISLLIYVTVSTGFVVSVHYCMNKVDSIKLGEDGGKECGKCGMHIEDSNGCCKDDVKIVKMQVDQAFAKILAADFSFHFTTPLPLDNYFSALQFSIQQAYPLSHGPPLSEQDIYLKNCVFRL